MLSRGVWSERRILSNTTPLRVLIEVSASFPQANIEMFFDGDLTGHWDGDRLSQLVINLLVNAIQHGHGAIRLSAHGAGESVPVSVSNEGKAIPRHVQANIFDPLHALILSRSGYPARLKSERRLALQVAS
jgi:signal transduction histidine kinase